MTESQTNQYDMKSVMTYFSRVMNEDALPDLSISGRLHKPFLFTQIHNLDKSQSPFVVERLRQRPGKGSEPSTFLTLRKKAIELNLSEPLVEHLGFLNEDTLPRLKSFMRINGITGILVMHEPVIVHSEDRHVFYRYELNVGWTYFDSRDDERLSYCEAYLYLKSF